MQERTIHITLECSVYNSDRESSCTLSKNTNWLWAQWGKQNRRQWLLSAFWEIHLIVVIYHITLLIPLLHSSWQHQNKDHDSSLLMEGDIFTRTILRYWKEKTSCIAFLENKNFTSEQEPSSQHYIQPLERKTDQK